MAVFSTFINWICSAKYVACVALLFRPRPKSTVLNTLWNSLSPAVRLPQVWAELRLTAGILWTLPGVPRGCLGSRAPEDQLPHRLPPALHRLPTRPWGQRRAPRRNRRPPRQSICLLAVSSSPITRETSAAWWMSISPEPSAATWMERANGGQQNKAQVEISPF